MKGGVIVKNFKKIWGALITWLMNDYELKRAQFLVEKFLPYIRGREILDLGCGSGYLGFLLKAKHNYQITLIDCKPSISYIRRWLIAIPCARTLSERHELPYQTYDGRYLPYPDESFDSVLIAFVLHHCENPERLLKEAIRITRKQLIILEDAPSNKKEKWFSFLTCLLASLEFRKYYASGWTREQWEAFFQQHGLEVTHQMSWTGRLLKLLPSFGQSMFILEKK